MCVYSLSVFLVFTIFCRLSDLIWMCRIHICCSHTCVCVLLLCLNCSFLQVHWIYVECVKTHIIDRAYLRTSFVCVIWIISCRFIGYTSSVYRHTFLTVHIDAHPLSVLSGLRSCTGVFASDVYDTHSDYAFCASAHFSPDFFIACQQYL